MTDIQFVDEFGALVAPLVEKLHTWAETAIAMLPNVVLAVVVVILFALGARYSSRLFQRILGRFSDNEQFTEIASIALRLGILAVGVLVALGILNLEKTVTSLLAGVGVIGLALGFAFQDVASNFMAGIIIAFRKHYPFKHGDLIETQSYFGTVDTIHLRSTAIRLLTGQIVLLPNRKILENPIVNYTLSGQRRVDIPVGVSYGDDLEKVCSTVAEALEGVPNRDESKPVEVFFTEFGSSSINLVGRFWLNLFDRQADFFEAQSRAVIAIKKAFDANDITIPFPIRTLDFGIKGGQTLTEALDGGDKKGAAVGAERR